MTLKFVPSTAMKASERVEAKRSFHWAWIILGVCFLDLFINYSVRLGYGVILPEMIRTLGFGRADAGSIYNAYLLAYISVTPLTGYLTDRLGARPVITCCCLVLGLGILLMGTIQGLATACLFYAVVGLGSTGMWTPIITLVQRWFSPRRRGFALGILSTGYGLGFASMGVVFPWIVHNYNWRYAWYALGAGACAMVLVNAFFLRSDPLKTGYLPWGDRERALRRFAPEPHSPTGGVSIRAIFKSGRFWLVGLSYLSIAYSLYAVTTFMVDYARYQVGLPLERASLLATIHGLGQIAGVLTILPLSDYLGRKQTIIVSNACITACLIGIVVSGHSPGLLFPLVGAIALFYGATFPIYGACAGDYFPSEFMGTVIGAWTPFYGLGAILSHWITGLLRDGTGTYHYGFIIAVVMAGTAFLLMLPVRRRPIIDH